MAERNIMGFGSPTTSGSRPLALVMGAATGAGAGYRSSRGWTGGVRIVHNLRIELQLGQGALLGGVSRDCRVDVQRGAVDGRDAGHVSFWRISSAARRPERMAPSM